MKIEMGKTDLKAVKNVVEVTNNLTGLNRSFVNDEPEEILEYLSKFIDINVTGANP